MTEVLGQLHLWGPWVREAMGGLERDQKRLDCSWDHPGGTGPLLRGVSSPSEARSGVRGSERSQFLGATSSQVAPLGLSACPWHDRDGACSIGKHLRYRLDSHSWIP